VLRWAGLEGAASDPAQQGGRGDDKQDGHRELRGSTVGSMMRFGVARHRHFAV
jgi:hypothetical protein